MSDLVAYFLLCCAGLVILGMAVAVVTVAYAVATHFCRWVSAAVARGRYGDGRWWKARVQ